MIFPQAGDDLPRHPSQLYHVALEGILLFLILWICVLLRKNKDKKAVRKPASKKAPAKKPVAKEEAKEEQEAQEAEEIKE